MNIAISKLENYNSNTRNANTFNDKSTYSKCHASIFLYCSAAAEEGNDEDDGTDDNQQIRSVDEFVVQEGVVFVVVAFNGQTDRQKNHTGDLWKKLQR